MNNEIKEILDRLERIDHKEYSCGFEFADIGSFDEVCRCFEERKKMADYITNLEQEIERQSKAQVILDDMLANYKQVNKNQAKRNSRQRLANQKQQELILKLQQENEHLRTDLNTFKNTIIEVNKECNSLFNHLTKKDLDYKSRCEKASELLELKQLRYLNEDDYRICTLDLQEVKDILQNGSDDK